MSYNFADKPMPLSTSLLCIAFGIYSSANYINNACYMEKLKKIASIKENDEYKEINEKYRQYINHFTDFIK